MPRRASEAQKLREVGFCGERRELLRGPGSGATLPEAQAQASAPPGLAQLRDGLRESGTGPWTPPGHTRPSPSVDRNPPVDRETARKNMSAGLFAGAFAASVFALCFVAAFLYIAQ